MDAEELKQLDQKLKAMTGMSLSDFVGVEVNSSPKGDKFISTVQNRTSEPAAEPAPESAPESAPEPAPESGSRLLDPRLKPTKYHKVGEIKDGEVRPDFGYTWVNKEEGDFTVRPFTEEEIKAAAGDNQDLFGTGYDDGPPTADPEPEIPIEDSSNMDMANSDAEEAMFADMEMQSKNAKAAKKAKRKGKGGYVDPQGKEPLIATEAGRTIDEIGAPERGLGEYAADAMAESAEPAPEVDYTDQAIALFKNTHGTSFDPKSRMDRGKLEKMKAILAERGGLGEMSPNQFALQVYRNS